MVVAAGAAAGKFLEFESGAPTVAAQTAYGIQAEVEGYANGYDPDAMLFMDFRRHHTGLWGRTAPRCASDKSWQVLLQGASLAGWRCCVSSCHRSLQP